MANRDTRAQIAHDTLEILERGWYTSPSGRRVDVAPMLAGARADSVLYRPEDFNQVLARCEEITADRPDRAPTHFAVVNATTLSAARRALEAEPSGGVLCLNFASAKHPGGGFLGGSQAQEESLARASGLYPCIVQMKEMYEANERLRSCLYTDHMIYSPAVPVFRDDDDRLLEEPYPVSFLTAPAVNAGAVMSNEPGNAGRIESVMIDRIEKMLAVAMLHRHEALVLGAWGCGVFRNSPADVARWFRDQLVGNERFRNAFTSVVFAVLDGTAQRSNLQPFVDAFEKLS